MNPLSILPKHAVRALVTLVAAGTLIVAAGCGGSGNNNGGGGGNNGNFTNASLNGHYAFTLRGFGLLPNSTTSEDYFVEGGVFTTDGNGNVTAGTDDYVQGGVPYSDSVSGKYTINSDGTGDLQLNFSGGAGGRGGFTVYRLTLSGTGHFYMVEDDGGATSAGSGEKQDASQLSTTPSGTFVVRTHDLQVSATMAQLALSGTSVSGSYDLVQGGVLATGAIGGNGNSIGAPTNGRGTLTYVVNGTSHPLFYYVVSADKFWLIDVNPVILSIGLAEKQSAITFSDSSFSGSYAFGSNGETTTPGLVNTVGVLTANGSGNINAANFDSVQDGAVSSNVILTSGSYAINADGSGTLTFDGILHQVWMVSASRAYFIAQNGLNVEDGTIDLQTGSFSNSSLPSQATFFMDGFDGTSGIAGLFKDRVGTLTPNGSGSLSTAYITSFFDPNLGAGGNNPNGFSGTYSVASNGRVTTQLNGFTDNIVFYLVSNGTGYMLQADAGINIGGAFMQQTKP